MMRFERKSISDHLEPLSGCTVWSCSVLESLQKTFLDSTASFVTEDKRVQVYSPLWNESENSTAVQHWHLGVQLP